jgi:hypothetical protein
MCICPHYDEKDINVISDNNGIRLGRLFTSTKEKIFFVVTFGNLFFHQSFTMIKCKRQ